ncbi:MAG: hypothetical protein AAF909_15170 [Pseudomonadota bacterium]
MKLDDVVLVAVAALAALAAVGYFAALIFGVIQTGGLLAPALIAAGGAAGVFAVVIRQRLRNREDDHYDKIER